MKPLARTAVYVCTTVLLLNACFRYRPADLGAVPEGSRVRVQLTRQAFAALPEIPYQPGPRLAGTLVGRNGDELLVRVPITADALNGGMLGQQVAIPASGIVELESRELDRTRTAIAIATGVAGVVALYVGFEKGKPFQSENPEQPEEEEGMTLGLTRLLQFSIRLR
jgi:hypothetical protein